ncbi:MAG: hypothetical protein COB14_02790 [Alphaproteobacteria bacterium]|nr:MAG: hypothetical protein COB14_02790 [Alphaproteobacteria bacterium]
MQADGYACKLNNISPQKYLADVLNPIADHSLKKVDDLLPHNWKK